MSPFARLLLFCLVFAAGFGLGEGLSVERVALVCAAGWAAAVGGFWLVRRGIK